MVGKEWYEPAPAKLVECGKALEIQISKFSRSLPGLLSYGQPPFFLANRRWGINVYPHGLKPSSKTYGQNVEVYLHIWTGTASENELQFRNWMAINNVKFTITITEPAPSLLNVVKTSDDCFVDIENEAGWFVASFRGNPRLLDLTNDTLVIRIDFNGSGGFYPSTPDSGLVKQPSLGILERLFDNPPVSDLVFVAKNDSEGREIHVQQCVLEGQSDILANLIAETRRTNNSSDKPRLVIPNVDHDTLKHLIRCIYNEYHQPPIPNLCPMYIVAESFALPYLSRRFGRCIYQHLPTLDSESECASGLSAFRLLKQYGCDSPSLSNILAAHCIHSWNELSQSPEFKDSYIRPTADSTLALATLLRRMNVVKSAMPGSPARVAENTEDSTGTNPSFKLDWRRCMAFRSLLSNPAVSDVKFLVEGKTIYAQKSVLCSVSEYFAAMFLRPWQESVAEDDGQTVINVPDCPYKIFHNLLLFLYINELDGCHDLNEMAGLYVMADKYGISDLMHRCREMILATITPLSAPSLLFTVAYKHPLLRRLVMDCILSEFNIVKATPPFASYIMDAWKSPATGCTEGRIGRKLYASVVSDIISYIMVKDFETVYEDMPKRQVDREGEAGLGGDDDVDEDEEEEEIVEDEAEEYQGDNGKGQDDTSQDLLLSGRYELTPVPHDTSDDEGTQYEDGEKFHSPEKS
ncbi:hypothetical protein SmJEL517_g04527 [Synchytrium microbalum]|uniref:BTB domain-containing protein n=1 Tax=Synchytrium microbalum TaxID=1806994 RepID=A0A507C4A3_9FUNG|nr:uncharacterized protein SmJEL517_g04527 [Synchytrium microbalum]TPX32353.1 hypothetical protein SmJEL517_g04527 [Synchytrium microbalum]